MNLMCLPCGHTERWTLGQKLFIIHMKFETHSEGTMKNELKWQTPEAGGFPMHLSEKGLDFKGKNAVFFYISGLVATLSLVWVIMLSIKLLQLARTDPNVPQYYVTVALVCAAISAAALYSFYKIFKERRIYLKEISIADGTVSFRERTTAGTVEWQEKLRKFEGLFLKHYSYRGVESWYIALVHSDKTRSFPVFAPDYESRQAPEEEKRKLLARLGSTFNLITNYEKPEEKKNE